MENAIINESPRRLRKKTKLTSKKQEQTKKYKIDKNTLGKHLNVKIMPKHNEK